MNTKIAITANGNVAPNKVIDLGFKYENVGDIITFTIPEMYKPYHHYLAFYMKRKDTILLPVNDLTFKVTTTITRNPGTYEIVFIATEEKVVDGDINKARKVFVSNTMLGAVKDNFLTDPVDEDAMDPNLQIIYDSLLDLRSDLQNKLAIDFWRGAVYIPDINANGDLTWTRSDGKDINIPAPYNVIGPQGIQGPFYLPTMAESGHLLWRKSQENMPDINSIDLLGMVQNEAEGYIDKVITGHVQREVNNNIRFSWDEKTKSLYIYSAHDLILQEGDEVEYGTDEI